MVLKRCQKGRYNTFLSIQMLIGFITFWRISQRIKWTWPHHQLLFLKCPPPHESVCLCIYGNLCLFLKIAFSCIYFTTNTHTLHLTHFYNLLSFNARKQNCLLKSLSIYIPIYVYLNIKLSHVCFFRVCICNIYLHFRNI